MTKDLFKSVCIQFINLPYRWGGDDPMAGFDCSGLVQELLATLGLDPQGDQTAQGLYNYFSQRDSKRLSMDTGTLLFFGKDLSNITHVGLALDPVTMIEAGHGGSKTTTLEAAIQQNAYIRLRPFQKRTDLVAHVTPQGLPW